VGGRQLPARGGSRRVHEARRVINSLVVTVVRSDKSEVDSPAFISVGHTEATKDSGTGYRPLSVVVSSRDFSKEALDEALGRLISLQKRYATIKELAPIWEMIDRIRAA